MTRLVNTINTGTGNSTTSNTFINPYRYGFNGKEKDDEVSGAGNELDFGARIYDPRLGRWLSVDPLQKVYPSNSPYNFVANSPIMFKDGDGKVITDPKSNLPVTKVDGAWKTVTGQGSDGKPMYGEVSKEFVKNSQPVLDKLTSSKVGSKIYDRLQAVSTQVTIDLNDKTNKQALKDEGGNSKFHVENDDFSTTPEGVYKNKVTITPNMSGIEAGAKRDGIDVGEKFIQTLSVEADHITDPDQIKTEAKYNHQDLLSTPEITKDVYSKPLNNAIKAGKEYRQEKGIPVDASSNLPVENVNKATGAGIKVE